MVIKSKDKTRACQRKGALSNWKVYKSNDLSSHLAVAENGKDDHQVLEEARDQRGRSATGDVGARRGDNSEGEQEEKGKGIRHLLCPWPRSATSRVSISLYFTFITKLSSNTMPLFSIKSTIFHIFHISNPALMRKLYKKWRKYKELAQRHPINNK